MLRFASVLLVVSLAASAATINTISLEVGLDTGFDFDSENGTSTSLAANLAPGSYSLSAVLNTSATGSVKRGAKGKRNRRHPQEVCLAVPWQHGKK